ncbi:MAG: hypothetical protein IH802_09595 [Nitrospinae bacterium]|nr:hypothetical protein [Nitrospinota bacterium]
MRNISNWGLYLGIKFGLTRPDPIYFTTRTGVVIKVPRRLLQTFKEVFMDECYMEALQRRFPKRDTVIDIGSNAGFFSRFAGSRFDQQPRIFSYEPIPVNFQQLGKKPSAEREARHSSSSKCSGGEGGRHHPPASR